MRLRLISALFFIALGLGAALSASPKLHDWLHQRGEQINHECAATLMSSGSVEHSDCEPANVAPQPAPTAPAFRTQLLPRVLAFIGMARLEHAPPLFS